MVERSVAIQPAAMWQEGLGLKGDALTALAQQVFIPYAKSGRFADGLKALVDDLNQRYRLAVSAAQAQLRDALHAATTVIPNVPAGADTTALLSAIERAMPALSSNDLEQLRQAYAELTRPLTALRELVVEIATLQGRIKAAMEQGDRLLVAHQTDLAPVAPAYHTAREHASKLTANSDHRRLQIGAKAIEETKQAMESHMARWNAARDRLQRALQDAKANDTPYKNVFFPNALAPLNAALTAADALDPKDLEAHERVAREIESAQRPLQAYMAELDRLREALQQRAATAAELLQEHRDLLTTTDTATAQAAIDKARHVALETGVNEMETALAELDRTTAALQDRISELWRQQHIRRLAIAGGVFASLALLLGSLIYGLRRQRRYRRGLEWLMRNLQALADKNSAAYQQMLALIQKRDAAQVTALHDLTGERTRGLLADVSQQIVTIFGGLEALEARVAECRGIVSAAPYTKRLPAVERAAARLLEPLSFQRETVRATQGLFAVAADTVTVEAIEMDVFQRGLETTYESAQQAWAKIELAIDALQRDPRVDFPPTGLQQLRAQLVAAQIPLAWLDQHPLTQPERTWAELDTLKQRDPVAYLEQLQAYQAQHAAFAARIAAIIEDVQAARAAKVQCDAIAIDYAQTAVSGTLDPREAERAATETLRAVDDMLNAATGNEQDVDRACDAVVTAYAEAQGRKERLRAVMASISGELANVRGTLAHLEGEIGRTASEAAALSTEHAARAMEAVNTPLAEAREDYAEGNEASTMATRCLAERDHFGAAAMARRIADECTEITEDLARARAAMQALRQAKQDATATIARATARIEEIATAQARSSETVAEMRGEFGGSDMTDAQREAKDADVDLNEARTALAGAREQVEQREYVTALRNANLALKECAEAAEDQADAGRYVQQLRDAAAEYARRRAALEGLRCGHAGTVGGYSLSVGSYLDTGDGLFSRLQTPSGTVDWVAQLALVHAVEKSWTQGIARAKEDYDAEQRRIAEARAEEERRRRRERERRELEAAEASAAAARAAAALFRSSQRSRSSSSSSIFGGGGGHRGGGGGFHFGGGGGGGGGSRGGGGGASW